MLTCRLETREQEAILAGYGKENEKLATELKQVTIQRC